MNLAWEPQKESFHVICLCPEQQYEIFWVRKAGWRSRHDTQKELFVFLAEFLKAMMCPTLKTGWRSRYEELKLC